MPVYKHEEFIGNEYRMRKRVLVSIFSKPTLLHPENKTKYEKSMLEDKQGIRSDVDAGYLQDVLRQISYPEIADVNLTTHRTKNEIINYIKDLDKKSEYEHYDYFFFVFLTYMSCGNNGSTVYKDERIYLNDGLCPMQVFYDEVKTARKNLLMKPKIFLIQSDDINLLKEKEFTKGDDALTKPMKMKIPQDADRLVIMSDIPQKLANRDAETKRPSFLIQAFGETLLENSRSPPESRLDLLALTPIINGKVQKRINDLRQQNNKRAEDMTVPLVSSTLTKLVKI